MGESRSEREAHIKDKAGWLITVLAALLAINTLMGGGNSSKVLNNTIEANNTWAFYQAKSIKQTLTEMRYDDALSANKTKRATELKSKMDTQIISEVNYVETIKMFLDSLNKSLRSKEPVKMEKNIYNIKPKPEKLIIENFVDLNKTKSEIVLTDEFCLKSKEKN